MLQQQRRLLNPAKQLEEAEVNWLKKDLMKEFNKVSFESSDSLPLGLMESDDGDQGTHLIDQLVPADK